MWKSLGVIPKVMFILVITAIIPFAPELMLIVDFGGMELVFGFLMIYYQPIILRIKRVIASIEQTFVLLSIAVKNSLIVQPKVYLTHSIMSVCVLFFTGSLMYSVALFMPVLMMNGMAV